MCTFILCVYLNRLEFPFFFHNHIGVLYYMSIIILHYVFTYVYTKLQNKTFLYTVHTISIATVILAYTIFFSNK